jgi:hypothetical protein
MKDETNTETVDKPQVAVSSTDWLDALAQRWERTASELFKAASEEWGLHARINTEVAKTWKQAIKELRAETGERI